MLRTSIDKMRDVFKLAKGRPRRYPAHTNADADYADDIALLANTLAQADSLRYGMEQSSAGMGLYINTQTTK